MDGVAGMKYSVPFTELLGPDVRGFDDSCIVEVDDVDALKLRLEAGAIKLRRGGGTPVVDNVRIRLESLPNINFSICGSRSSFVFGASVKGSYNVTAYGDSTLEVGAHTTSNGSRYFLSNSSVRLGEDCMLSDEVLFQASDQHGIIDIKEHRIINDAHKTIALGNHVWIARSVSVMPGVQIGKGSIVGACSVVTRNLADCTLSVGVPARVVKEGVSWSRHADRIDARSETFLQHLSALSPQP